MGGPAERWNRWRALCGVLMAVVMGATALVVDADLASAQAESPLDSGGALLRNSGGRWDPVEDWPMIAIHAALDSNGRVVTYGTNPDGTQTGRFIYDIWTPSASAADGHRTLDNTTRTDLFCSLQLNRSDTGDMVLFGGDNWTGTSTTNQGNPDINQLNASTGALTPLPGMNRSRWYATGTTMPNGSMYIQGGRNGQDRPERWSPATGAELLPIDTIELGWWYPRNFVIPDGRIFGIAPNGWMYYVSETLDSLEVIGRLPQGYANRQSTSVMYQPGRILVFGGSTVEALTIDVTGGGVPVIEPAGRISSLRHWVDATLLPDGRVLANGGSVERIDGREDDPISSFGVNYTAEIWDPRTRRWTVGSSAQVPRLYHSTSLLLPDGRVLTAGGGAPGPVTAINAEIYHPDYLHTATGDPMPRPRITGLSDDTLTAGQDLTIAVDGGTEVSRVTLVKSGSVTHSFNMEQRFVELDFAQAAGSDLVATRLPDNDAVITPGFYLLTVLDGSGIPSESELVKIEVPDPERPTSSVDGIVIRLYQAAFDRGPDRDAFVHWRRHLLNGGSPLAMAVAFASSAEFFNRYGPLGDAAYVDRLYRNVLDRVPAGSEVGFWTNQLAAGSSRAAVLWEFADSAEFRTRSGTGDLRPTEQFPLAPVRLTGYEGEVRRLYLGYFLREPDNAGLTHWSQTRAGGASLVAVSNEFADSAEARRRYGDTTADQFIDLVYGNVLGRSPEPGGRQYWRTQLSAGLTRGEMMVFFTESTENVSRVG